MTVDNLGRTLMWVATGLVRASCSHTSFDQLQRVGPWIASVEWLCFVCLHTHGAQWKADLATAPAWVANVMRNSELIAAFARIDTSADFKTATGVFVISGLHVLPIALLLRSRGHRSHHSICHFISSAQWRACISARRSWCWSQDGRTRLHARRGSLPHTSATSCCPTHSRRGDNTDPLRLLLE